MLRILMLLAGSMTAATSFAIGGLLNTISTVTMPTAGTTATTNVVDVTVTSRDVATSTTVTKVHTELEYSQPSSAALAIDMVWVNQNCISSKRRHKDAMLESQPAGVLNDGHESCWHTAYGW